MRKKPRPDVTVLNKSKENRKTKLKDELIRIFEIEKVYTTADYRNGAD